MFKVQTQTISSQEPTTLQPSCSWKSKHWSSVFVCKSMQRIKGGGVSKQAIWFVFFSKLKMWNLKTRDRTVVEVWTSWIWFHFWTTTPIISHGVPTSEFACCLKKWEWKMLSFPRKHNFQFISGKELLYLMKEFWNGTSFRGHSSPWASSCQAPVICTHQNTMVSLLCTVVVFSKDSTAIPNVTIIGQKVLVHLSSGITG